MCVYTYTLYHIYKNIDNTTHFDCSLGHSLTSSDLRNIREPNISMEITRFKTVGGYGQSEVELVIPAHFFIRKIIEVRTPHFWYSANFHMLIPIFTHFYFSYTSDVYHVNSCIKMEQMEQ